jgi:hypothetical protein
MRKEELSTDTTLTPVDFRWTIPLSPCLLSLWRVARGSKRMFLELIHGLFIT